MEKTKLKSESEGQRIKEANDQLQDSFLSFRKQFKEERDKLQLELESRNAKLNELKGKLSDKNLENSNLHDEIKTHKKLLEQQ